MAISGQKRGFPFSGCGASPGPLREAPAAASSVLDPARHQQGLQAAQEWMWKNRPAGFDHSSPGHKFCPS
ncbi:hypothetical protein HHK36_023061 [Tetracentron sinense]|uniref:Uncharacterized protein n=1 Tax=Tetracentron sinense TaxID=13715 RepID=A0A834YQM5_TETSI|nr:hypothetical protein HHK36_023061 [Tetracentron sinense]